jgi:transposase-like protein
VNVVFFLHLDKKIRRKKMSTQPRLSARAQQMFALIETYLTSGLSQKNFCEQHQLTLSTLQHWRRKYAAHQRGGAAGPRQDDAPATHRHEFIPLRPRRGAPDVHPPAQWVIEFPHGVIVRCSGALDFHLLAQLIHSAGN